MMDYSELVKSLRICANEKDCVGCKEATDLDESGIDKFCVTGDTKMVNEAADAIEELGKDVEREKTYTQFWEDAANNCKAQYEKLLRAAKKMHTWIFLHSYDEQKAYDECGLYDEMNAALGYGGKLEIKVNDDV